MPVIAGTDDSKEGIMLKKEIRIGRVYAVKVGTAIRPVRIDKRSTVTSGWNGTNLETGRTVTIRTAAKCRYEMWENPLRPGLYGARFEPTPVPTIPAAIANRFVELMGEASPENISRDGERPARQIQTARKRIAREWLQLEKQLGRQVTVEEAGTLPYTPPERQASKSTSGMIEEAGRDLHSSCVVCGRAFSKPRRRAVCNSAAACAARAVS